MSSITNRTITLVISETLNFAVQFLSPIFLVRILDINTYGQYREFIVYSSLILSFASFSIKTNLLYFISKDESKKRDYLSNTIYLLLFFSLIGVLIVFFLRYYLLSILSFNFIPVLIIYIICYQNTDILDSYWLSIKRSDLVLYWSSSNAIVRTSSLILTAYFTHSIWNIIYLLIILEILKTLFTLSYIIKNKLFTWKINVSFIKEQLKYILPNGFASVITKVNNDISKVVISSSLGPAALAIYAVGSQNIPFLNIIRNAVSNVIFPEIAARTSTGPKKALNLWHKANLLYFFLMAPLFIILMFYANIIITIMFTAKYSQAIPIFRIYSILLLRKCFEMSIPIRAMNKNKYFVAGNILYLSVNIILIYILYNLFGFIGPAVAVVIAEIVQSLYLGSKILTIYEIKFREILLWDKLIKIGIISLVGIPIIILFNMIPINYVLVSIVASILYLIVYIILIRKAKIEEIDLFMKKMFNKVRISW